MGCAEPPNPSVMEGSTSRPAFRTKAETGGGRPLGKALPLGFISLVDGVVRAGYGRRGRGWSCREATCESVVRGSGSTDWTR